MSNAFEFPGFGRVIDRSSEFEDEAEKVQHAAKTMDSPSSSLSTGRMLSGRCLSDETHVSPRRVSPDEAQLICKSVLSELFAETAEKQPIMPNSTSSGAPGGGRIDRGRVADALTPHTPQEPILSTPVSTLDAPQEAIVSTPCSTHHTPQEPILITPASTLDEPIFGMDLAKVNVIACDRGCVMGNLEWSGATNNVSAPQKVAFSLLQIQPGYAVIGDVMEGPKLLSSLCWKVQSVNGCTDANVAWIRRGDRLLLEGPRWATKRLIQAAPAEESIAVMPRQSRPPLPIRTTSMATTATQSAAVTHQEGPPLLRNSAPPQIASPSRLYRPFKEASGTSTSRKEETPCSASELGSEVTSSASKSQERPSIPTLDLAIVSRQRQQRLKYSWVPETPKDQVPSFRHQGRNVCVDPTGCDLGWVECSVVVGTPVAKTQG